MVGSNWIALKSKCLHRNSKIARMTWIDAYREVQNSAVVLSWALSVLLQWNIYWLRALSSATLYVCLPHKSIRSIMWLQRGALRKGCRPWMSIDFHFSSDEGERRLPWPRFEVSRLSRVFTFFLCIAPSSCHHPALTYTRWSLSLNCTTTTMITKSLHAFFCSPETAFS